MFNKDDANKNLKNLTDNQALEWAKKANTELSKYRELGFSASESRNGAIKNANNFMLRRFGHIKEGRGVI